MAYRISHPFNDFDSLSFKERNKLLKNSLIRLYSSLPDYVSKGVILFKEMPITLQHNFLERIGEILYKNLTFLEKIYAWTINPQWILDCQAEYTQISRDTLNTNQSLFVDVFKQCLADLIQYPGQKQILHREKRLVFDEKKALERIDKELKCAKQQQQQDVKDYGFVNYSSVLTPSFDHECKHNGVSVASIQGRRNHMEDRYLITSITTQIEGARVKIPIFAIFDGHNGSLVSEYLKNNFASTFKRKLEKYNKQEIPVKKLTIPAHSIKKITITGIVLTIYMISSAILSAISPFLLAAFVGSAVVALCFFIYWTIIKKVPVSDIPILTHDVKIIPKKTSKEIAVEGIYNAFKMTSYSLNKRITFEGGSTATVAILLDGHVYVANSGDSRCIIIENKKPTQLSNDAKPDIESHQTRVIKRGGKISTYSSVSNGRVKYPIVKLGKEEIYALAASIGDKTIKDQRIIADKMPHRFKITRYRVTQNSTLILGSDGAWDVASTDQMARKYVELPENINKAAKLVETAYCIGSNDNITVITADIIPV